jgi:hypothetical protein
MIRSGPVLLALADGDCASCVLPATFFWQPAANNAAAASTQMPSTLDLVIVPLPRPLNVSLLFECRAGLAARPATFMQNRRIITQR